MTTHPLLWTVFTLVVAGLLYIDLRVFNRHAHEVSIKEASLWTVVWIAVALLFGVGVQYYLGEQKALEYITAYVIEKTLSVDNMFVFIMIFSYFGIEAKYQPRVLHWGILGALVMRLVLILVGVQLLQMFHWIIYVFGVLLIYTAYKMAFGPEEKMNPEKNPVLRLYKKFGQIDPSHRGEEFFIKKNGRWIATTLFAAVLVVEASDLVFAIDSIPAVLAISPDPFIVYTSNAFAILGLRALYFVLAGMAGMFGYLKYGIAVILGYVGVKMLISHTLHIPTFVSLSIVFGVLLISILISIRANKKAQRSL